ncbi:MAG: sugar phosphate isomerase/epimerase family protein [Sphaerochaetaceae bacterium]
MTLSTEIGALRELTNERRTIEILSKAGFRALDYTFTPWMERGEMEWNRDGYKEYAKEVDKMAKDNGIYFNQAHAPFIFHTSYLPDWNREIIPLQVRCMESCALLGIPHMVVHPVHHLPYRFNKKEIWKLNKEYYHLLQPYAKEFGVKIALENMFSEDNRRKCLAPDMFSNPTEYAEFYDDLHDEENFICLVDTGHSGIVGEDAADTIRVLGKRVKALHINDNMFYDDGHLIPFQGLVDWDDVMKALAEIDYQGDFTFEALYLWRGLDEDFFSTQAKYLYDVGQYLIRKFEKYKAGITK